MSRYIDADKFRKTLIKRFGCVPSLTDYSTMLSNDVHIDDAINLVPTADVVEVVRCKDCKHAEIPLNGVFGDEGKRICVRLGKLYLPGEFYCRYGEKGE